jgi:hypothetical protein
MSYTAFRARLQYFHLSYFPHQQPHVVRKAYSYIHVSEFRVIPRKSEKKAEVVFYIVIILLYILSEKLYQSTLSLVMYEERISQQYP